MGWDMLQKVPSRAECGVEQPMLTQRICKKAELTVVQVGDVSTGSYLIYTLPTSYVKNSY